jgi:PAS domain S-box-containing protein
MVGTAVGDSVRSWYRSTLDEDALLPAQIALSYLLFGVLWIILSDHLVASIAPEPAILSRIQTLKGWAFVAATALFLYLLVRSAVRTRRRLRRRKEETDRFLNTLLENLPGAAYACRDDSDWTMTYLSAGAEGVTGYSADELTAPGPPTYGELIVESDRQRVRDEVRRALVGRRPFQLEYHIRTKQGKIRRVWEQGRGVFGDGGRFRRFEGFICDVTDLQEHSNQARTA